MSIEEICPKPPSSKTIRCCTVRCQVDGGTQPANRQRENKAMMTFYLTESPVGESRGAELSGRFLWDVKRMKKDKQTGVLAPAPITRLTSTDTDRALTGSQEMKHKERSNLFFLRENRALLQQLKKNMAEWDTFWDWETIQTLLSAETENIALMFVLFNHQKHYMIILKGENVWDLCWKNCCVKYNWICWFSFRTTAVFLICQVG